MIERTVVATIIDVVPESEVVCPDCHNKVRKGKLVCPYCSCPLIQVEDEEE